MTQSVFSIDKATAAIGVAALPCGAQVEMDTTLVIE